MSILMNPEYELEPELLSSFLIVQLWGMKCMEDIRNGEFDISGFLASCVIAQGMHLQSV